MAYEVRKHNEAYYYVIYFESEPDFIIELERNYRIIDEIIKFIVVKQDFQLKGEGKMNYE